MAFTTGQDALHPAGAGAWADPQDTMPTSLSAATLMQHNLLLQQADAAALAAASAAASPSKPSRFKDWLNDDINRFEEALAGFRPLPGRERLQRVVNTPVVNTPGSDVVAGPPKLLAVSIKLKVKAYDCTLHN